MKDVARWYLREKRYGKIAEAKKKLEASSSPCSKVHEVYTDCSVVNQTAGAGVYFGLNHPDNLSTRLQASLSTPQQAELEA